MPGADFDIVCDLDGQNTAVIVVGAQVGNHTSPVPDAGTLEELTQLQGPGRSGQTCPVGPLDDDDHGALVARHHPDGGGGGGFIKFHLFRI